MKENINLKSIDSAEHSKKDYENNLQESMKLNSAFNTIIRKKHEYISAGKESDYLKEISEYRQEINNHLIQRVKLLQNEGIKTIGPCVPLRVNTKREDANGDKTIFYTDVLKVANELGYEGQVSLQQSPWLILKKGDKEITLKYHINPIESGVGGGRIELINIEKKLPNEIYETVCHYDKNWLKTCEDINDQKEIDTIVATLR